MSQVAGLSHQRRMMGVFMLAISFGSGIYLLLMPVAWSISGASVPAHVKTRTKIGLFCVVFGFLYIVRIGAQARKQPGEKTTEATRGAQQDEKPDAPLGVKDEVEESSAQPDGEPTTQSKPADDDDD